MDRLSCTKAAHLPRKMIGAAMLKTIFRGLGAFAIVDAALIYLVREYWASFFLAICVSALIEMGFQLLQIKADLAIALSELKNIREVFVKRIEESTWQSANIISPKDDKSLP